MIGLYTWVFIYTENFNIFLGLEDTIKREYELCIFNPSDYNKRVELISNLLGQKGKNKLISETCPVFIVGKYNITPFVFFGINPGHSDTNSPIEDKVARSSWENYNNLYQNFFSYFKEQKFESPYYTALAYLVNGLALTFGGKPAKNKWELFEKYLTNIELVPYHSRGISIPSILKEKQLRYLKDRFDESANFIVQFNPKLFIFNGNPWHTLLIKNNIVKEFEQFRLTDKFSLFFFTINDVPSVLLDKFFQGHYWGLTSEHRSTTIPQIIAKKYPFISLTDLAG